MSRNLQTSSRGIEHSPWEPITNELPLGESVKLVFKGLTGIARSDSGKCVVGFHGQGDNHHEHLLRVKALDRSCNKVPPGEITVPSNSTLTLEIVDPVLKAVEFYIGEERFVSNHARNDLLDEKDFRWIIDAEADYFYGQPLSKNSGVYGLKLVVANGIFYTAKKTNSTFRSQTADGRDVIVLGNVAEIIAANIYLNPQGSVNLHINGQIRLPLPYAGGPYQLHFDNHCEVAGVACHFNPYNLRDKEQRNDFYMNYRAFDLPTGKPEYELVLEHQGETTKPQGICPDPIPASDESPCSSLGYGRSGGGLP